MITLPFNLHRFVRERHLLFCHLIVANQIDVNRKNRWVPPTTTALFFFLRPCVHTFFLSLIPSLSSCFKLFPPSPCPAPTTSSSTTHTFLLFPSFLQSTLKLVLFSGSGCKRLILSFVEAHIFFYPDRLRRSR